MGFWVGVTAGLAIWFFIQASLSALLRGATHTFTTGDSIMYLLLSGALLLVANALVLGVI